jgi:hypothetical protein
MSQKSSALSILFEGGETLAILIPLTLFPKNHNFFCEGGLKRGREKKESL